MPDGNMAHSVDLQNCRILIPPYSSSEQSKGLPFAGCSSNGLLCHSDNLERCSSGSYSSVLMICTVPATTGLLLQLPLGSAPDAHLLCPPAYSPKTPAPGPQETPAASQWVTTRSFVYHTGMQRSGSHPQVFHWALEPSSPLFKGLKIAQFMSLSSGQNLYSFNLRNLKPMKQENNRYS